jgi:hypothetical protein
MRGILIGLSLLIGAGAASAAPTRAMIESSETLLRYSGLERQLGLLGDGLEQQFRSQMGSSGAAAEVGAQMASAAREAFSAPAMRADALARLHGRWDPARAGEALAWLRSPVGRAVIGSEEAASKPEAYSALQAYATALPENPPDPKRIELVRKLDAAVHGTDQAASILEMMAVASARAVDVAKGGAGAESGIEKALAAQRPALRRTAQALTLTSYLYNYRDLSDAQLAEYLRFLASSGGRWYVEVVGDAFHVSMESASKRFSTRLASLLSAASGPSTSAPPAALSPRPMHTPAIH